MRKITEMIRNVGRNAALCGALIGVSGCAATQIQDNSYLAGPRKNTITGIDIRADAHIKEAFDWYKMSHQLSLDEEINLLKNMDKDNNGQITEEEAKQAKKCAEAEYRPLLERTQKILAELDK
ncbi:MAG: hypothetical protein QW666_02105 [Candidatus Woesearchaeota archaeon]